MIPLNVKRTVVSLVAVIVVSLSVSGCKKDSKPSNDTGDTGVHHIDSRYAGKWMWTKGSDQVYYDDNGVYHGSAYGFAIEYVINADGTGTSFSHVYSSLSVGTGLEVNISSKGFFESDENGHLGFFPTSGTYKSSSGTNRALRPDELWDTKTNTGRNYVYQVTFTTQGGKECFQVTSSDGKVDTFFRY